VFLTSHILLTHPARFGFLYVLADLYTSQRPIYTASYSNRKRAGKTVTEYQGAYGNATKTRSFQHCLKNIRTRKPLMIWAVSCANKDNLSLVYRLQTFYWIEEHFRNVL
jgi:hypothetical protein